MVETNKGSDKLPGSTRNQGRGREVLQGVGNKSSSFVSFCTRLHDVHQNKTTKEIEIRALDLTRSGAIKIAFYILRLQHNQNNNLYAINNGFCLCQNKNNNNNNSAFCCHRK